ncbi:hypothetical protein E1287_18350 [Actinomadura sp. KC06]|uniref:hypothetical protein n=1 Tax=Actinomadura sp. KC06 TaxID=2530369 RepID=UPI0010466983|nr:hypothetical protein [Actinomadura sp. KC06]TDD33906.1 hypothetical protein E1287_18350 [Actinomadura sp. KC06]
MVSRLLRRPARPLLVAALAVLLAGASPAPGTALAAEPGGRGTTVCFVARDNPDREHTIRVPSRAVPKLLRTSLSYVGPCAEYGHSLSLGDGAMRTYTQRVRSRPLAMGVTFRASTLRNLPIPVSDGKHCFDKDGSGDLDLHKECAVGHELVLDLPRGFRSAIDTPFKWSLTNWNPQGHMPTGVYDVPHFDFHFYIQPLAERNQIRPGPCPMLTNCDDYKRAKLPVPERYRPPDFSDVDAVEPAMGNHLIDLTGPEFNGRPFTHTWIYGQYDGEITFYEAMITKAWFDGQRKGATGDICVPFKQPREWRLAGWYPTSYCIAYRENRDDYTVALTDFRYRGKSR